MIYISEILELIKIANLVLHNEEMPNYADEIHIRFNKRSKYSFLDAVSFSRLVFEDGHSYLTHSISDSNHFIEVIEEIWSEIENNYAELFQYAAIAHKTVIGRFFNKLGEERDYRNAKEILTRLKIENFIKLVRIGENLQRVIAYTCGWNKEKCYSAWQNENYSVFDEADIHPFIINPDGTAKFSLGIVQFYLEKIDIFRIKACINCSRIFWAKPKHMKYCSNECRNRQNVKKNYKKNKLAISEKKKKNYKATKEKNGTL